MPMNANTDAIERAARMTGLTPDAIKDRMEQLEISQLLDLLDSISSGDGSTVKSILASAAQPGQEQQQPSQAAANGQPQNAEVTQEGEGDADETEFEINPLFMKDAKDAPKKKVEDENIEEEDHDPAMGDEVRVNGEDAIVKIVHGPHDTVGVQMDGTTAMVNKDQVKRVKTIEEGVMAMSPMMDLRRMQELAGVQPTAEVARDENPLAAGRVGVPMPGDEGQASNVEYLTTDRIKALAGQPAEQSPVEQPANDDAGPSDVEIEVVDTPECPIDGAEAAQEAPVSTFGLDDIMAAFDAIEDGLPDIKLGDAKNVRARLNDITNKLNETNLGRARKS